MDSIGTTRLGSVSFVDAIIMFWKKNTHTHTRARARFGYITLNQCRENRLYVGAKSHRHNSIMNMTVHHAQRVSYPVPTAVNVPERE